MPDRPTDPNDETRVIERDGSGGRPTAPPSETRSRGYGTDLDPTLVVAVLAGAIALFMLVVGIVTLARAGVPVEDLTGGRTTVGPFARSSLMGIIEIIGGLAMAGVAASRQAGSLTAFGLIAIVFGLVWLIEPQAFGDALGVDRGTAWTYLFLGALATAVGLWAPERAHAVVVRR
ncbi:MAG: DUF4383 domain-containing protein [Actinobacteria bacterium]|nr:DUF4383 domain-containing protein [Actinomycetota bacterium]